MCENIITPDEITISHNKKREIWREEVGLKEVITPHAKTIERLEEVAKIANEKRKAEEEGYGDDDDGPLKISTDSIKLDFSDVQDLDKTKTLEPAIKLDIETLS